MIKEKIDNLWSEKEGFRTRLRSWLNQIHAVEKKSAEVKRYFHQWSPLRAYVQAGFSGNKERFNFSLRFSGQEVASLDVLGKAVYLKITEKQSLTNNRVFPGLNMNAEQYLWRGKEAQRFRKFFSSNDKNKVFKLRFPEHGIESRIIREMLSRKRSKFGGTFSGIQPVTISGFPLQFPVPISASSGEPRPTSGHIDILARHRSGKVCLCVWELKGPGKYKNTLREAYIYTVTLLKMLRDHELGGQWYKIFGFSGKIPDSLRIECVVAITRDQGNKLMQENLHYQLPRRIGDDSIDIFVSFYDEKTLKMDFQRI